MRGILSVLFLLCTLFTAQSQYEWPPKGEQGVDFNVKDKSGQKQGLWYRTYSEGGLYYAGTFKDGKPAPGSVMYYYYENGKLMAVHKFREDANLVDAVHYHQNGKVQSEGLYRNQKKEGKWTFYDEQGNVTFIENFKDDLLNGQRMVFYPDGKELRRENYVNDLPEGEWVEFFENGQIKGKGSFSNGKLDGLTTYYHPNGTKASEGEYRANLQQGNWMYFHSNGKLHIQASYENGEQKKMKRHNGDFIDYYPSGIPQLECSYKDGELHGPFTEYYEKGEFIREEKPADSPGSPTEFVEKLEGRQASREGEYKNGKLDGDVVYYSENGDLIKTETYDNGTLIETIEH